MSRRHALFAALLAATPVAAAAHPHVFIDAAARFVFDDAGRLAAVEIEHLYDPLVSLFVLNDLGVDPFAPLPPEDAARLAEEHRIILEEGDGFVALAIDRRAAALGAPEEISVSIAEERMQVRFTARLAEPAPLAGRSATLAVYDPVYFIAFDMTGPVEVAGPAGCSAEALEWAPSDGILALQSTLLDLALDETPDDPTVGRLFAAEARVQCD